MRILSAKKRIIVGAAIGLLLVAAGTTALVIGLTEQPPDLATLLTCDNELRKQLLVPTLKTTAVNARSAVRAIQEQRPASCRSKFWNPFVTDADSDHLGNIEISFSTRPGVNNGADVTTTADGNQRWVYLAEENQWYAAKTSEPSRLATPPQSTPTALRTQVADPTPGPSWYRPPPTNPAPPPPTVIVNPFRDFDYIGDEIFTGKALTEFNRGEDLYLQGEYRAAILAYQLAQNHRNEPSRVVNNRIGTSLQELGDHRQALIHFTAALDIQDNPLDRVNRAVSYFETDQCPRAIQDAERALEMQHLVLDAYHSDAEANAIMAVCYLRNEQYSATIDHADKVLQLMNSTGYPDEELAAFHRIAGTSHQLSGNYSEAIRQYSNAITLDDDADARASRAWTYWETDDCTSAIEDGLQAIAMMPVTALGYHTAAEGNLILYYCYADEAKWNDAAHHAEAALLLMHKHGYDDEMIELVEHDLPFLRRMTNQ